MIVLDTHIWVWWLGGGGRPLKAAWLETIVTADACGVSAISCFEMSCLVKRGRIELAVSLDAWFVGALGGSNVRLLPITPTVARLAANLPDHHRDPHDRLIIATALEHDAKLVSADGRFGAYEELKGRLVQ